MGKRTREQLLRSNQMQHRDLQRKSVRVAELEAALVDLRSVAETTYVCKPPKNSAQWDYLLDAIGRANTAIGIRSVEDKGTDT